MYSVNAAKTIEERIREIHPTVVAYKSKIHACITDGDLSESNLILESMLAYTSERVFVIIVPTLKLLGDIPVNSSDDSAKIIANLTSNLFKLREELIALENHGFRDSDDLLWLEKHLEIMKLLTEAIVELCVIHEAKLNTLVPKLPYK